MNNGLKCIFAFSLGAAAGSVVTWKLLKTKYEQIAQEEIESVKEVFSNRRQETVRPVEETPTKDDFTDNDVTDYHNLLSNYESDLMKHQRKEKGGSESMTNNRPYVISPDEFGENDDYETVSLTYYADGILTDDRDDVVEEVDDIVGIDSLSHFGEYEDDSVFVRNDELKCDYEILMDYRNYADATTINTSLNLEDDE